MELELTDLEIISELTEKNQHTEALEKVARMFDLRDYYKRFSLIEKLHDIEGSMPYDLAAYRLRLYREMLEIIKGIDADAYSEIYKRL